MIKWEASTVVAWGAAAVSTTKVIFDYFAGNKDRQQKSDTTEHQINSAERIDLTKILKESLDSLRQDVVRLEEKSSRNETSWLEQAHLCIKLEEDLSAARAQIITFNSSKLEYEEIIQGLHKENIELRFHVDDLTRRVMQLQSDNTVLQGSLNNLQHQVNQNSEAIVMDLLPVGVPEAIINQAIQDKSDRVIKLSQEK